MAGYGWWQNTRWSQCCVCVCVMQIVAPLNGRRASFYRTTKSAQEGTPQTPASLNAKRLWAIRRRGWDFANDTLRLDHVRRVDLFGAMLTADFSLCAHMWLKLGRNYMIGTNFSLSTNFLSWVIIPNGAWIWKYTLLYTKRSNRDVLINHHN